MTAVPDLGYHFVDWSDASTQNPRTDSDTGVTSDISVTANFAINSYTLTYNAGSHGSVTGFTPQTVDHGANGSEVTAVPDANYHFTSWSDASTQTPRADTGVTAGLTVTAQFAINTYTLAYTAGSHGSVTGATPQTVNHGADGSAVTAVADANYHFTSWSDASTQNPRTDLNVTGDVTVEAQFAINTYTLTYNAGSNGSVTGTSPQSVDHGTDGSVVTAVPDANYHFTSWSDSSTQNPRTDTGVTGGLTVTAQFAINTYTLAYTAGSHGSVTGSTPQTVDHGANGSEVTAVPDAGYTFTQWSDAITDNPRTDLSVTAAVTVTAMFNAIPVAGADNLDRPAIGRVVKVLKSLLLANDTDADLETLTITNVSNALPSGATVALVGNFVVYTAPDLLAGDGSFEYTLSDGIHSVTGTVTVLEKTSVADSPPNIVSIALVGSDVVLKFIGVPGRDYVVQYTTDTGEPYTWQDVVGPTPITAPASGVMTYTDENPTGPTRFYRAVLIPVIGS